MGDFWGVSRVLPELNDGKGVSLVIVRTEKAEALLETVQQKLVRQPCEYTQAVKYNRSEYRSAERPPQRDDFYRDMNAMSFEELERRYLGSPLKRCLRRWKRMVLGKTGDQELSYGLFLVYRKGGRR